MDQSRTLESYAHRVTVTLRYADTDRQGHINNAVFATLLESGRVALIYNPEKPLAEKGCSFVIARLELDFLAELNWPGDALVGSSFTKLGRSSFELAQAIFQDGNCAAVSRSTMVQISDETRRSHPLSGAMQSFI